MARDIDDDDGGSAAGELRTKQLLQHEDLRLHSDGPSPLAGPRSTTTTPSPRSTTQPPWSPPYPVVISGQKPFYQQGPLTLATHQPADARRGPSPTSSPATSSHSISSWSNPAKPHGPSQVQFRQLPRLKTFVGQNPSLVGRDGSPLMYQLERWSENEDDGTLSSLNDSVSPDSSTASLPPGGGPPPVPFSVVRQRGHSTSATTGPAQGSEPTIPLRPSASIPDYKTAGSVRPRTRNQQPPPLRQYRSYRVQNLRDSDSSSYRPDVPPKPVDYGGEEMRTSF